MQWQRPTVTSQWNILIFSIIRCLSILIDGFKNRIKYFDFKKFRKRFEIIKKIVSGNSDRIEAVKRGSSNTNKMDVWVEHLASS